MRTPACLNAFTTCVGQFVQNLSTPAVYPDFGGHWHDPTHMVACTQSHPMHAYLDLSPIASLLGNWGLLPK